MTSPLLRNVFVAMATMATLMLVMTVSIGSGQSSTGNKNWSHKNSIPVSSMTDNKPPQTDLTRLVEQVLAGNDALLGQLRTLQEQQRAQRDQLDRMSAQQEVERQQQRESFTERQQLKQMISNLTSELSSVEDAASGGRHSIPTTDADHAQQQLMRMRVRRELQALACNVTAELQTVIGIVETTNHRLQVVEAQNTQLRVHIGLMNEAMLGLERRIIGNLSSTVALQLQQQNARDRQRTDTVLETMKNELRTAVSVLRQRGIGAGGVGSQPIPVLPVVGWPTSTTTLNETASRRARISTNHRLISIQESSSLVNGQCVWGAAEFNNELYVARSAKQQLEIYDLATLTLQRQLLINGLGCFNDVATAAGCDVMYVVDNCNRLVHVVDEHGFRSQWPVGNGDTPLSVTVTPECNALVTFENTSRLHEYTNSGELVREVSLQYSDVGIPTNAVKLTNNRYIIGQGNPGDTGFHRVCALDAQGTVLQSFGGEKGSDVGKLNTPGRLIAVNDFVLFVLDSLNDRIVMLNTTTLTRVREVISVPTATQFMLRMSLSPNEQRLYISHNDFRSGKCQQGYVKVFDLRWLQ